MSFDEWKKETFPDGCIIKVLYGNGVNIERPLKCAYEAGYEEGKNFGMNNNFVTREEN